MGARQQTTATTTAQNSNRDSINLRLAHTIRFKLTVAQSFHLLIQSKTDEPVVWCVTNARISQSTHDLNAKKKSLEIFNLTHFSVLSVIRCWLTYRHTLFVFINMCSRQNCFFSCSLCVVYQFSLATAKIIANTKSFNGNHFSRTLLCVCVCGEGSQYDSITHSNWNFFPVAKKNSTFLCTFFYWQWWRSKSIALTMFLHFFFFFRYYLTECWWSCYFTFMYCLLYSLEQGKKKQTRTHCSQSYGDGMNTLLLFFTIYLRLRMIIRN